MSDWKAIRPKAPSPDDPQTRQKAADQHQIKHGLPQATMADSPVFRRAKDGDPRPVMLGPGWWGAMVFGPTKVGDVITVRINGWGAWRTTVTAVISTTDNGRVSIVDTWPPRPEVPELPCLLDPRPLEVQQQACLLRKEVYEAEKDYRKCSKMLETARRSTQVPPKTEAQRRKFAHLQGLEAAIHPASERLVAARKKLAALPSGLPDDPEGIRELLNPINGES